MIGKCGLCHPSRTRKAMRNPTSHTIRFSDFPPKWKIATYFIQTTTPLKIDDMKGTDHFKRTIQMYLEQRAAEDALFAKSFRNPAKNMDDCVTYILNWVKQSGCCGFSGGEIVGQAIHYFDENEIEVGNPIQCKVVVNHPSVELTEEEKAEARKQAIRQYQQAEFQKLQNRNKPSAKKENQVQPSLFDF